MEQGGAVDYVWRSRTDPARAAVRVLGDGSPPVSLLIHGTASSGRIWLKMLRTLQDSSVAPPGTFILPDLPGMGDSDAIPHLVFEDWLDFVREVAQTSSACRPCRRIRLVGHSLGGAIAMHLAGEDWVDSVALVAPATAAFCRRMRQAYPPGSHPGTILMRKVSGALAHDSRSLTREDASMLREDFVKAAPLLQSGLPWPGFLKDERELLAGKRVLVIWGEEDAVVEPGYARSLAESLSRLRHIATCGTSLPACGHIPMIERPLELGRILSDFWNLQSRHAVSTS